MNNIKLSITLGLIFLMFFCGCKGTTGKKDGSEGLRDTFGYQGYSHLDSTLVQLKSAWEGGLRSSSGSPNRSTHELYTMHAHGMKWDLLNKIPLSESYPYKSDFEISKIKIDLNPTDALVNNCGYEIGQGDSLRSYKYYCLNYNSAYFESLEQVASQSQLIGSYISTYKQTKSITPELIQMIALEAEDQLDFNNKDHQMFYALHHIVFNEEQKLLKRLMTEN